MDYSSVCVCRCFLRNMDCSCVCIPLFPNNHGLYFLCECACFITNLDCSCVWMWLFPKEYGLYLCVNVLFFITNMDCSCVWMSLFPNEYGVQLSCGWPIFKQISLRHTYLQIDLNHSDDIQVNYYVDNYICMWDIFSMSIINYYDSIGSFTQLFRIVYRFYFGQCEMQFLVSWTCRIFDIDKTHKYQYRYQH